MREINSVNKVQIEGTVIGKPEFSHEVYGEAFWRINIKVMRLSKAYDILPVLYSERLLGKTPHEGDRIAAIGQFRSHNKIVDEKSKLILTVFVREFTEPTNSDVNSIELSGCICKSPIYRTTPFSREICDILLAVNRAYSKSDYIPCIAWGRNARFVKYLGIGERVVVQGRIQSRAYQKRVNDDCTEERMAYEVSTSKIVLCTSQCESEEIVAEVKTV